MSKTMQRMEYGVKQVADQLHDHLARYIEARYHVRDEGLIRERRAALADPGTISQRPYIESTPTYEFGDPYDCLGLPDPIGATLADLASWQPDVGVFRRPFLHQAEALRAFFVEDQDLIVATGTGSGKTETFLLPILGQLLREGAERPGSYALPGFRALVLYPMNALVSDQVTRLRRLFGDDRVRRQFHGRYGRCPTFGMYTSRTPYPGRRTAERDRSEVDPLLRYYLRLDEAAASGDREQAELARELRTRGRWPAKDLRGFAADGRHESERLRTRPLDAELLTRQEIQASCPDILVTNYSMLEYMLLRPIERSVFAQTAAWLAADRRNTLLLVLDEAHMYRGVGGAEVGFLVRRLEARLGLPRERVRCILTSASLGSGVAAGQAARRFASGLVGCRLAAETSLRVIHGTRETRPDARVATVSEAESLSSFDLTAFHERTERPGDATRAVAQLATVLGWPEPPALASDEEQEAGFRSYLYRHLFGWGPVEMIIRRTAGQAEPFVDLAQHVFPSVPEHLGQAALAALLAIGTFAHDGERVLMPTRAHLLFRGLPSLYACINPECDRRRSEPGATMLLGRLHTEPRIRCECSAAARVYELFAHRDCGAVFLRVFGRGQDADFYWHEPGGAIDRVGEPLDETLLLVEEPHASMRDKVRPVWMEITTGRVETTPPSEAAGFRVFYRPAAAARGHQAPLPSRSTGQPGATRSTSFIDCPVCTKKRAGRKILDLATKGDQPFANLVREQLILQPAVREPNERFPNGGRKVLLFSDGRQKAARLARDLPREVEFDSFRQAIVLAAWDLERMGKEPLLDDRLYIAFVAVCARFDLHFFDPEGRSQQLLLEDVGRFRRHYDDDLETAIEEWRSPVLSARYRQALLRQLSDPFYSLYAVASAVVSPSRSAVRQLARSLDPLPGRLDGDALTGVATAWIQELLEAAVFDPALGDEMRRAVHPYFEPMDRGEAVRTVEELLANHGGCDASAVERVRSALFDVLTVTNASGRAYLSPSVLRLTLAVDAAWLRCEECGFLQYRATLGRCARCGSPRLQEQPIDHPHIAALTDYFRAPLRAALGGARPIHVSAEEHTAQLSQRDKGMVYATTEEFELRFQDVWLGPEKPPVDILSCTTTMEVGIDIGSLTAVGLRNVPPQRENYQQRSGRSGRRGAAVSTVLTYAQEGPHDSYYFHRPEGIISGAPREPRVRIDNLRLARRHVHSFLIQAFFHGKLDDLPEPDQRALAQNAHLFSALGKAKEFFNGEGALSLRRFKHWIETGVVSGASNTSGNWAGWLPDEPFMSSGTDRASLDSAKQHFVTSVGRDLLGTLDRLATRTLLSESGARGSGSMTGGDATGDEGTSDGLLIDLLFDEGLLPSYAFPTDLCGFYVFERDGKRVRVKERPQQSKDKALSEYAPGRLLVINKQTYRVGGIYTEGRKTASPARAIFGAGLGSYVYCSSCTYVRIREPLAPGERCPICREELQSWEWLDPPGFSPERGEAVAEFDTDQDLSYATGAQFPLPVGSDRFEWHAGAGARLHHAYGQDQRLVIVNKGPLERGFIVCESCGAAWPAGAEPKTQDHARPFQVEGYVLQREGAPYRCRGKMHEPIFLGHSFLTDLLLIRASIRAPLAYDPAHPWLHDALRTSAEAIALGASLQLDIDPGEVNAGYRLIPPAHGDEPEVHARVDVFLYDTASGGAGFAAEAGEAFSAVLDRTQEVLGGCPQRCERSCTGCLRHYGNRFWHERLDRHLALQLLEYARTGTPPRLPTVGEQIQRLGPFQRFLELEGWRCRQAVSLAGVVIPLLAEPRRSPGSPGLDAIAVGTYPALLDPGAPAFDHELVRLGRSADVKVALMNDYVLARDLPTAYRHMRRQAGLPA
jgi:ATP-dependent helicase YprA (DUF1998 family)